jgi:lysozyme
MHVSQDAIDLITRFKGCRLTAYRDHDDQWTVGYSHKSDVSETMVISIEQAVRWLAEDLGRYEDFVAKTVHVPLQQHQFDALVAFAYDLGTDTLWHSDLLAFLNAHQYDRAADAFLEFGDGVRDRRRMAERDLFRAPPPKGMWQNFLAWMRG